MIESPRVGRFVEPTQKNLSGVAGIVASRQKAVETFSVPAAFPFVPAACRLALLSVFELLVQFRMAAVERHLPPVDEKVTHVGARFEQIAVGHDEVGDLAGFD